MEKQQFCKQCGQNAVYLTQKIDDLLGFALRFGLGKGLRSGFGLGLEFVLG